jgi:RimJ/RimL family protein N-acetyltransferase
MGISYERYTPDERDELIAFVVADTYPYNGVPQPTPAQVAQWIDDGLYTETFWIVLDGATRVGILQYQDASAIPAEVHIRLHTSYRGQGIGAQAMAWLTDYLFRSYPEKHRIEGWTRVDNAAMRRVFFRRGYVKEAHLREDFPAGDGTYRDKIGYGILRGDWQTGVATPVRWGDEPGKNA